MISRSGALVAALWALLACAQAHAIPLAFGDGARMACELELPAGALSCAAAGEAERSRLGLCFPVQ